MSQSQSSGQYLSQSLRMEQRLCDPRSMMMLGQSLEQTLYIVQHLAEVNIESFEKPQNSLRSPLKTPTKCCEMGGYSKSSIDGLENTAGRYPEEHKKEGGYIWTRAFADLKGESNVMVPNGFGRSDLVVDFYDGKPKVFMNPDIEYELRDAQKKLQEITKGKGRFKDARSLSSFLGKHINFVFERLPKIAQYIFEKQREYIKTGKIEDFQPLLYRELAKESNLHDSTVYRLVQNKSMETLDKRRIDLSDLIKSEKSLNKLKIIKIVRELPEGSYSTDEQLARLLTERGHSIKRRAARNYRILANDHELAIL